MSVIYKYALQNVAFQGVAMPKGAEILCVQTQRDVPCIWARVNPAAPVRNRKLLSFGTGEPISGTPGKYIGTYQLNNGRLVFHLYEEAP